MEQGLPSINVLIDAVQRHQESQRSHFESLDSKAGITLGFAGAIAAIARDLTAGVAQAGLGLAVLAAILAVLAFRPRKLPIFDPLALRRYLRAEEQLTKLRLLDTQIEMGLQTSRLIAVKARWLMWALVTLVSAVVLMVGGTLLP